MADTGGHLQIKLAFLLKSEDTPTLWWQSSIEEWINNMVFLLSSSWRSTFFGLRQVGTFLLWSFGFLPGRPKSHWDGGKQGFAEKENWRNFVLILFIPCFFIAPNFVRIADEQAANYVRQMQLAQRIAVIRQSWSETQFAIVLHKSRVATWLMEREFWSGFSRGSKG